MKKELLDSSRKLFVFDDSTLNKNETVDKLRMLAKEILTNNEWVDVFECWDYILRNECDSEEKVIAFVKLMFDYLGFNVTIPYPFDPYDFIGYIYSKIDLEKNWDRCGNEMDSFVNAILVNSNNIDLIKDPYYQFWRDPKVLEIAKKYGKH